VHCPQARPDRKIAIVVLGSQLWPDVTHQLIRIVAGSRVAFKIHGSHPKNECAKAGLARVEEQRSRPLSTDSIDAGCRLTVLHLFEDERNQQIDLVSNDLLVLDLNFLLFDPGTPDLTDCLAGACDALLNGILEALLGCCADLHYPCD